METVAAQYAHLKARVHVHLLMRGECRYTAGQIARVLNEPEAWTWAALADLCEAGSVRHERDSGEDRWRAARARAY